MKKNYPDIMHRFLPVFVVIGLFVALFALFREDIQLEIKKRQFANSPAINELSSRPYVDRILLSDGKMESGTSKAVWFNRHINVPEKSLVQAVLSSPNNVLGDSSEEKWIEIDLSRQLLFAHEGTRTVYTFPISSGLPWMPTVTGEFRLWAKLRSQRMMGGSIADGTYYNLPNVPFVQYFYKGYGIHGAYWHNDFGKPRSHGCVNLSVDNARTLYYWTNPILADDQFANYRIKPEESTRVVIHGVTPKSIN